MAELNFPLGHTMEEVISALRNEDPITELKCVFVDTNFNTSRELQDAILANTMSGRLQRLHISNVCFDQEVHN
jgi:hypothetical protein